MWAWTDGAHRNLPAKDLATRTAAHCTMSPNLATFIIASRSASRSDCPYFVCSLRFLEMAARHCEKLSTTGTQKPHNLRLHTSLKQLDCQHLRIHAQPMRVLLIQY